MFSRGGNSSNSSNSSNSNAVNKKGNSPSTKKIDIPAVTTSNKAFTHVTPTTFACYPAAFLYKTKKTKKKTKNRKKKKFNKNNEDNDLNQYDQDMDNDYYDEDGDSNDYEIDNEDEPAIDVDGSLLDWCPDPLVHLLSFFILPSSSSSSSSNLNLKKKEVVDTDNITDMVSGARLRTAFDRLGSGQAIPVVPLDKIRHEPLLRAMLGEDTIDSMCRFFERKKMKEKLMNAQNNTSSGNGNESGNGQGSLDATKEIINVTWGNILEWQRFHKFNTLSRRQTEIESTLLSKPILLKKFTKRKIYRQDNEQENQNQNGIQLLTNVSVWADTTKERFRIDVVLHPSDGSKYRAYVYVPTTSNETGSNTKSPKSKVISNLL